MTTGLSSTSSSWHLRTSEHIYIPLSLTPKPYLFLPAVRPRLFSMLCPLTAIFSSGKRLWSPAPATQFPLLGRFQDWHPHPRPYCGWISLHIHQCLLDTSTQTSRKVWIFSHSKHLPSLQISACSCVTPGFCPFDPSLLTALLLLNSLMAMTCASLPLVHHLPQLEAWGLKLPHIP